MKKINTLLLLIFATTSIYAQGNFEKGYIVTNDDKRIDCEIDNKDWKENPKTISYKLNNQVSKAKVNDIKAFEVFDYARYESKIVKIAISEQEIDNTPNFIEKLDTLFLKVLLKGNPSLYSYDKGFSPIYFYQTAKDTIPLQLKYKLSTSDGLLVKNNQYKNQLSFLGLNCGEAFASEITSVVYNSNSLIDVFKKINTCNRNSFEEIKNKKKSYIHACIQIRPGFALSSLNAAPLNDKNYNGPLGYKSGLVPSFRLGMALEITSTAKLKNWSALIEAYYQGIKNSKMVGQNMIHANVRGIDLLAGPRRYFKGKNLSFYVGAYLGLNAFKLKSQFDYNYVYPSSKTEVDLYSLHVIQSIYGAAGIGARYKKIGFEALYTLPYNNLSEDNWHSAYSNIQVLASIDLF